MTEYNTYYKFNHNDLKYKFKGSEKIIRNYSQSFQDIFVLCMLDGKENGTYVEIGGDHPIKISNSYLLETEYHWKGLSFEINPEKVQYYNSIRKNVCICADATGIDYDEIFLNHQFPKSIDYLQVDIEPSWQTLKALKKLPLDKYRFSVITFETDLYNGGEESAEESHNILSELGYELVLKNVACQGLPYENWYVDPNVVDRKLINIFKDISDISKESVNCVLNS
jgi:hypothetical protein